MRESFLRQSWGSAMEMGSAGVEFSSVVVHRSPRASKKGDSRIVARVSNRSSVINMNQLETTVSRRKEGGINGTTTTDAEKKPRTPPAFEDGQHRWRRP